MLALSKTNSYKASCSSSSDGQKDCRNEGSRGQEYREQDQHQLACSNQHFLKQSQSQHGNCELAQSQHGNCEQAIGCTNSTEQLGKLNKNHLEFNEHIRREPIKEKGELNKTCPTAFHHNPARSEEALFQYHARPSNA